MAFSSEYELLEYLGHPTDDEYDIEGSTSEEDTCNVIDTTIEDNLLIEIWYDLTNGSMITGLMDLLDLRTLYDLAHDNSSCYLTHTNCRKSTSISNKLAYTQTDEYAHFHLPTIMLWQSIMKQVAHTRLFDSMDFHTFYNTVKSASSTELH